MTKATWCLVLIFLCYGLIISAMFNTIIARDEEGKIKQGEISGFIIIALILFIFLWLAAVSSFIV